MKRISYLWFAVYILVISCQSIKEPAPSEEKTLNWKQQLRSELPQLGHRNWLLVVDKAFPLLAEENIKIIQTDEQLVDVLNEVKNQLGEQAHVKPILYKDLELDYLNEQLVPGIETFKKDLYHIYPKESYSVILHNEIFAKMDAASKLFKVLVLKTNAVMPYSSVFMELDCKYWNADKEILLRDKIKKGNSGS
jgi:D-ribose pyranose/furanose isomerase RbsD